MVDGFHLNQHIDCMNKYSYLYVLQGYYSHGWEDLTAEEQTREGRKNIRATRKEYQDNERGSYRIIKRRELNKTV